MDSGARFRGRRKPIPVRSSPDGPVVTPRWIGSGWTIWNNKGKPVRKYEPFFADARGFQFRQQRSASARRCSTTLPDESSRRCIPTIAGRRCVFDPWRQDSWDANDTVLIPDPSADADVGSFFQRLPQADYMPTWYAQRNSGGLGAEAQDAAQKAAVHANTPSTVHFDTLGRPFLTLAFNRSQLNARRRSRVITGHSSHSISKAISARSPTRSAA